jgi:hypothetical protein
MMEFVLSKVWLFIGGLTLLAVVLASFGSLNSNLQEDRDVEAAEGFSDVVQKMASAPGCRMSFSGDEVVPEGARFTFQAGAIIAERGGHQRIVPVPIDVELIEGGRPVESLAIGRADVILLRSVEGPEGTIVQLEKVDATALTASTNLLLSSSVL